MCDSLPLPLPLLALQALFSGGSSAAVHHAALFPTPGDSDGPGSPVRLQFMGSQGADITLPERLNNNPFKSVGMGKCSTTQAEVPPRADWFIDGHAPVQATSHSFLV